MQPHEDHEGRESKRLRLVSDVEVSADTMDCVYLDVDICVEMSATTTVENTGPKNVQTPMESTNQWRTNLMPDKIVYGTKSRDVLDPLTVEKVD